MSLVAPYLPVVVVLAVTGVQLLRGRHMEPVSWIMAFALALLVLGREVLRCGIKRPLPGTIPGPRNRRRTWPGRVTRMPVPSSWGGEPDEWIHTHRRSSLTVRVVTRMADVPLSAGSMLGDRRPAHV